MKRILTVPSIKCEACAKKISNALYSYPEVEEILVDVENKIVEIEMETLLSDQELKKIMKYAGNFEITEIK